MSYQWTVVYPGVKMRECYWNGNVYRGSADALIAAGLVQLHQLPGQPTSGKTMASFRPDGTRIKQGTNGACNLPGYMHIVKRGALFDVSIRQDDAEMERRYELGCQQLWVKRDAMVQPASSPNTPSASTPSVTPTEPLFQLSPDGKQERAVFEKHVMRSLRELVDFSQTSQYDA